MAERGVAGALAGMAVANAGALGAFVATSHVMGVDRALEHGTWRESDLFAVTVVVLVTLAGAAGGAACGAIARRWWVVAATSLLLLGWWGAEGALKVGVLQAGACEARSEGATLVDGAREGLLREPTWSALVSPVAIGIGMLMGGMVPSRDAEARSIPNDR